MSNYHKKDAVFADTPHSSYKEKCLMVLHNGEMNNNGFISITTCECITQHTSGFIRAYVTLEDLIKRIKEKELNLNLESILNLYTALEKTRNDLKLPIAKNRHEWREGKTYGLKL